MTDCRSRLLVIPTVLLLASGCGSSGSTIENRQPDPEEEVADSGGVGEVAELPEPDIGPELPPVELPHEVAEETGGPACAPGEGCFLDSCDENAACQSGWCVDHMGAGVCTIACEEDCPPGWSCQQVGSGPDVTYVCIANHANLCRPCGSGDNCKSPGGAEDVCVDYGAEGSFCGGVCETDEDCPWGFSCVDGLTVDGIATRQCVADAGVCPCTKKSIELALWTPCARANEWGECTGQRICTQEGLSACDAAEPMPETCNGLDDDCDGQIDEPEQVEGEYVSLCFDGNPCTKDQCGGADGCSNAPMDQGECMDGDACTVGDHCEAGACVGLPVACDDNDPCTDDLCDGLGGCKVVFNTAACDDEDPCTVADVCIEGKCAGVSVPCDCQTNADCAALDDGDVCNGKLICDLADWPYQCSIDPASIKACPAPAAGPNAFCLKASCDPLTGACSLVPDHEGFACSDGNACTTGEHCVAGVCGGAVDLGCLDDNPCTDDSCEPAVGCIYKANSASCSDGNVCTTNDKCTATVCAGGAPLNCDDGSVCNGTETCDSFSGCKAGQPLKCDDGNACNGQEACDPVKGCQAGAPPVCDDLNVCTDDTCDPVKGCAHKANAALCDDGNVCTVGDACLGGLCAPGTALDCDDQNPCTVDSCSSSAGCVHVPLQDGVDCTMPGVCQGACASGQCEEVAMESCDGKDNDCDGVADESGAIGCSTYYKDTDGDGYGSDLKPSLCLCAPDPQSEYTALVAGDCLDQDSAVHPEGTEKCDGKDNDCDGSEDPPKSAGCSKKHKDADSDGWGVGGDHLCVCADFELYTATSVGDCDDGDPEVHFGAAESCNGKDNNCDGLPPPENLPGCFNFHEDADSDSFGKSLVFKCLCEPQWLFKAKEGGDCDDANSFANPSMGEDCDTVFDDDCDGDTNTPDAAHCDAYYLDGDLDGYGSQDGLCLCAPKGSHTSTTGGDCADDDPQVYPSPHAICGIDADCDGSALDPGESCDDGNDKSWDGCTSCKVTELRVNSQTLWGQWGPSVAGLTDGGFAVAWTSNNQDGSYDGIFAQLFLADGSRDGNEFQVNTYTFKSQRNPSVARLAEGGFVVVWEGYAQDTSDSGVFGQMFNADGSASGNEFQVNTYTPGNQVNADVAALGDGGFVVAWESPDGGGKYYGVFCQRFDSGGARAGAEFQADSYMLGDQRAPAVAGLGGGEFVVTWHSMYQDFSGLGVFGQRFSAAGTKLGTEFQVNTQTEKNQGAPSVAPLAGGGFLVAFDGQGTGWSGMRIFRARFYPDGTNQGTDLEVSVYKGSSLTGPRLAPLAGGGAAVVWNSQYQDGAAAGVFGRRLSSIGVPDGAEIQVNTYTVGDQYEPAVASLTDGGFVVAWSSWAQDGSQEGVFAQMFDAGGSKVFPAASQ